MQPMCDIKPCLHDTTCCTTGCTTCCTTGYTTGCIAYTQQDGDRYKPYEHKIPTHSSHVSFLELPKFCLTFSILVACIQLRCLHSALVALGRSCASQISVTIRNTKQPQGLSRSDGKCPDGLTLVPWQSGKPLVWDVTVVCPLKDSYIASVAREPSSNRRWQHWTKLPSMLGSQQTTTSSRLRWSLLALPMSRLYISWWLLERK